MNIRSRLLLTATILGLLGFTLAAPADESNQGLLWNSEVPEDCPFPPSESFQGVYFTGQHSDYQVGDTFYPSWASDGIWYYGTYLLGPSASYTHHGFTWNWPNLGPMPGFHISRDFGQTWEAPPTSPTEPLFPEPETFLGPVKMGAPQFVDFGKNMEHSPDGKAYLLARGAVAEDPLPRPCIIPGPEGVAYAINERCTETMHLRLRPGEAAHPELSTIYQAAFEEVEGKPFDHGNLSWVTADQVYLARVTPSPETINDLTAYEFYAGRDAAGEPVWTHDFAAIQPLLEWNNNMGCVTATWVPGLQKYLMCVTNGWPTVAKMDSYILEADVITGPWRMVAYLKDFGEQAYFLNFPSKFISNDGKTLWLSYSANFSNGWNGVNLKINPPGGRYGLSLHELQLIPADDAFYTPERDQYGVQPVETKAGDSLPKVLLIGDSIMGGYFQQTKQLLEGEARVFRHPGNAGDTRNGLKKLDQWLGDTKWDVIHFNWGLHDLCYRHPEATVYGKRDKVRGTLSVPLDEYAENLEALVQRLKQTGARLIFASTTCIPEGEAGRFVNDAIKYNKAALEVMQRHGIAVNDLYAVSSGFGPEMYVAAGDVHHTNAGNATLARQVAEAIRRHAGQE